MVLGVPVDPPADFRHPQRDAVMLEQRRHRRVLAAVERPLVLPDHDRVPPAVRIRELRDQRGGLRAPRPRQGPALPRVEELRHDHPAPRRQHHRLLQLPRPRRHRILPVLGRDPPVEREPQAPPAPRPFPAAGQALRPRRQHIPARPLITGGHHPHRRPSSRDSNLSAVIATRPVNSMAAITADASSATDRSPAAAPPGRTIVSWPLLVLAAPGPRHGVRSSRGLSVCLPGQSRRSSGCRRDDGSPSRRRPPAGRPTSLSASFPPSRH